MKIRILEDGTLALDERMMLVRGGAVAGAMALVALFAWTANARGDLTGREMVGGTAGLLGLIALASAVTDRSFRFQRTEGRVLWTVRRLFSTRYGEVAFDDVRGVVLRESVDADQVPQRISYQPMLDTQTGQLPLSSFHGTNAADSEVLSRAIHDALGRAYAAPREATLEELIAADRVIDAVKRVRRDAARSGRIMGLAEAKAIVDGYRQPDESQQRAA